MTPEHREEPESLHGGAGVVTVSGHRWQRVYPLLGHAYLA
jgi:hypothetical protein